MYRPRKPDKERIKKILLQRRYKDGKPPKGYEVHHIIPLEEGGKDTSKNIRVVKKSKHRQIHANRRRQGRI
jgi:5-methylcytosine-specific restriction endonuclease McrA